MAIDYGWQNRTVLGNHAKDSNEFKIVEKNLPILTNESDALFLVTRDQFFTISTAQISNVLTNYLRYKRIYDGIRIIANVMLIPGLAIAFAYLLRYVGVVKETSLISDFLSSNIANALFGLSIFNIFILWHDYYKDKSHPVKLPKAEKISLNELEDIRNNGFTFGRYAHLEAINYVGESTLEILCRYSKEKTLNIPSMFGEMAGSEEMQELFKRANIKIDEDVLKKNDITQETLPKYPSTAARSLIIYSLNEALLTSSTEIQPKHLLLALFNVFPVLNHVLFSQNSSIDILREVIRFESYEAEKKRRSKYFNPNVPYYRKGGIAEAWVYGYTFILNHFAKNLNEEIAKEHDIYGIGHAEEVESLVSILGKVSSRNALLIGDVGVGKSSIALGLAQRINSGDVPMQIKNKRILQLDINGLIAHSSEEKKLELLISKAVKELENAGDAILYIDEIYEIVPTRAKESGQSVANIFLPYVLRSKFPIIGTINYTDYKKYFYSIESLRQSFTNIEIKEVSAADTLQILETKITQLEKNYEIYITFPALISTVELAQRYNKERKLPSSAVRLIDSTCSWAQGSGVKILTEEHVSKVLSNERGISIGTVNVQESTKLMKLEENIKNKVVGQQEAIKALVEALRRAHVDIRNPNKPIGTFLFMGPTGVGKTYVSKVVAEEFFEDESNMIRVDMSEYKDIDSVKKFLGSQGSNSEFGSTAISLVDRIKINPYTVVLFDEMEKAHPQILDLFLQIFDEGRLTSNQGEVVDFTHSIIVCTSNIASATLLDSLSNQKTTWEEAKKRALVELRQSIKPELLNRFDRVLVFHPHNIENLSKISDLLLKELANRLQEKGYKLTWTSVIPQLIANKAHQPGLGARPIRRYIQDHIEGNIAKELLNEEVAKGDEIEIKESWIV